MKTLSLDQIDLHTGWPTDPDCNQVSIRQGDRRVFCTLNVAVAHHVRKEKIPDRYLQVSPIGPGGVSAG